MKTPQPVLVLSTILCAVGSTVQAASEPTPPSFKIGQQWRLSSGTPLPRVANTLTFRVVRIFKNGTEIYGGIVKNKNTAVVIYVDRTDHSLTVFDDEGLNQQSASTIKELSTRLCMFDYSLSKDRFEGASVYGPQKKINAIDPSKIATAYLKKNPQGTTLQTLKYIAKSIGNDSSCLLELVK